MTCNSDVNNFENLDLRSLTWALAEDPYKFNSLSSIVSYEST